MLMLIIAVDNVANDVDNVAVGNIAVIAVGNIAVDNVAVNC